MKTDIILAGVGGQGILSIATILARAAMNEDLYIKQAEVHGMSQRGGDVQSNLRISDRPIASDLIPQGKADLIISLEPMEALRYVSYLAPEGWIVTNTVPFINVPNYPEQAVILSELDSYARVVAFDVDSVAKSEASLRSSNMVLLGAAAPFIQIAHEKIEEAIRTVFGSKSQSIVDMNIKAFRAGFEQANKRITQ
ncbi:MAG: indolepyruvate oxidoreductase subunit beta [Muribaculaceae bacterium]|nr:indolepyruvate oxidoreductase subunit beta [Muribaculaceae bacterium]